MRGAAVGDVRVTLEAVCVMWAFPFCQASLRDCKDYLGYQRVGYEGALWGSVLVLLTGRGW